MMLMCRRMRVRLCCVGWMSERRGLRGVGLVGGEGRFVGFCKFVLQEAMVERVEKRTQNPDKCKFGGRVVTCWT